MEEDKNTPLIRIPFKKLIPYLVFLSFVMILLLSSSLNNRPPEVSEVNPKVCEPGEELIVTGRFFGSSRNGGKVMVGSVSPPSSSYLEWKDNRISLIVPEELKSGLLYITTKHGKSRQIIPFTNSSHLPVVLSGPLKPGEPYISEFEPKSGSVGTMVTIRGLNFGLERGESQVLFSWIANKDLNLKVKDDSHMQPALDYDFDYVQWSDREIKVRVPDGASSGSLKVNTDKGTSNAGYFEVKDIVGSRLLSDPKTYHVQSTVEIAAINADPDNSLYLWVPRVVAASEQREVKIVSIDPQPMFDNYRGFMLFAFENLERAKRYSLNVDFIFSRYTVETNINAVRVPLFYDRTQRLYQHYTSENSLIPSSDKKIKATAFSVVGKEKNPYSRAWLIYNYVTNWLSYDGSSQGDALQALQSKKGNAYAYSLLFCALARSIGIPARPVAGYLVTDRVTVVQHFWAEFYLEKAGWVPVDPLLGDGVKFGSFPSGTNAKSYYFGNLDNQHICFSKGLVELKRMNPNGRLVSRRGSASFQSVHEEYTGNLKSYTSNWRVLKVLGIH
jgi:hypothetical protein